MNIYILAIIFSMISALGHYYSISAREIAEDMDGSVDTADTIHVGSTQNAIMDPRYSKPIIIIWLITFCILLSSFFSDESFLFLLLTIIISSVISIKLYENVFPKNKMLHFLINGLIKRKARYQKEDDNLRAGACDSYISKLQSYINNQQ